MTGQLLLAASLALMGPPTTPVKASAAVTYARVPNCVFSIIDEAQVPAREAGELMEFDAREGKPVQAGQVLGQIDDQDAKTKKEVAELDAEAAEAQATNDIRIRAAVAGADVADAEYKNSLEIQRRNPGAISKSQLRKEELNVTHAKLQIDLAKHEYAVAGMTSKAKKAQVKATDLEIARRQIVAPLDGVIVQVSKHKGEWVQPGDPVLRMVRMDKLRIEGFLNAQEYAPIDVADRPVTIEVNLTRGRVEKFTSKIEFVSSLVEASGEYRIWAEVDNRLERNHWVLRPGMLAEMSITLELPPAPASSTKLKTTSK
jgi:multidrug resistance efflux pump